MSVRIYFSMTISTLSLYRILENSGSFRSGDPYRSSLAEPGDLPGVIPDVPICSVLIVLYMCFAAINMTIFQLNRRRQHKFVLSAMLFGFCVARAATLVVRIAWATRQDNIRIPIAAQILVNAAHSPGEAAKLGGTLFLRTSFKVLCLLTGVAPAMIISSVVIASYSLDKNTRSVCRITQIAGLTYFLVLSCLPLVHVAAAILLPRSKTEEGFGRGGTRSQALIIILSLCLCSPPRSTMDPAWYDSKACLYAFYFAFEIIRFFIPNRATRPGDYTGLAHQP
ncbi:hypothetical protein V8C35DRAFT_326203 [Trichoderma chlorosporum]